MSAGRSLALLAALGLAGCQLPGAGGAEIEVSRAVERGPYLDAELTGEGRPFRALAPRSAACRYVLERGARVTRVDAGPAGRYLRRDAHCDALGIGAAEMARGRAPDSHPVPRAQARFGLLHQDGEVVLLRGSFPLAVHVGWKDTDDLVVAIPNAPACRTAVERGFAGMEFRPRGVEALALVGRGAMCPIVGLARPPPGGLARATGARAAKR